MTVVSQQKFTYKVLFFRKKIKDKKHLKYNILKRNLSCLKLTVVISSNDCAYFIS